MRAMKDSGIEWIGMIPQGWKTIRIKHFLDRSEFGIKIGPFGSTLANRMLENAEINVYSQANLVSGDFSVANHTIDSATFQELKSYEVKPGDICVSMMGTVGKCKTVPEGIAEGIMDSHLIKIRLDDDKVDYRYFEYVYDKDNGGICFVQIQYDKKGTIMDGLNTTIVKNLVFPFPKKQEQARIADYLDAKCAKIDALITAKEKINALLREQRQSIIYEAVTKGLAPNAPMKDSGVEWIGKIPVEWSVRRLKLISRMQTGTTPKTSELDYFDGSIKWFTPGDFDGSLYLKLSERTVTEQAIAEGQAILYPPDSILFVGIGATVGKVALSKEASSSNQQITAIIMNEPKRARFYAYWLSVNSFTIKSTANYTTLPIINNQHLGDTPCPFAEDQEEQVRVADYLDEKCEELNRIIATNEATIQKLKEYRQSMIYEAVTGKVEV